MQNHEILYHHTASGAEFRPPAVALFEGFADAARTGVFPDDEALARMRQTVESMIAPAGVSQWERLLVGPDTPSVGLAVALETGYLAKFHPEAAILASTPQDPESHPEGVVWNHNALVVDELATILKREGITGKRALTLMLGGFTHDFGKPATTVVYDDGGVSAKNHEAAGVAPAATFLASIGADRHMTLNVLNLVRYHMRPRDYHQVASDEGRVFSDNELIQLAADVRPAGIDDLAFLAEADINGRGATSNPEVLEKRETQRHDTIWMRERADQLGIGEPSRSWPWTIRS